MSVKNSLIKIAYENPELRADLLPVITGLDKKGGYWGNQVRTLEQKLKGFVTVESVTFGEAKIGPTKELYGGEETVVPVDFPVEIKIKYHKLDESLNPGETKEKTLKFEINLQNHPMGIISPLTHERYLSLGHEVGEGLRYSKDFNDVATHIENEGDEPIIHEALLNVIMKNIEEKHLINWGEEAEKMKAAVDSIKREPGKKQEIVEPYITCMGLPVWGLAESMSDRMILNFWRKFQNSDSALFQIDREIPPLSIARTMYQTGYLQIDKKVHPSHPEFKIVGVGLQPHLMRKI